MPVGTLKLGEWLPDLPPLGNPGALVALNVFPCEDGYLPVATMEAFGPALPEACLAAISARATDGNAYTFAATAHGIYRLNTASTPAWDNVSTQKSGITISFVAPDTINDSANGLDIFQVGDTIIISGDSVTDNNGTFTVDTVAAGTITTVEQTITNDAAGDTVLIIRDYMIAEGYGWEWVRWKGALFAFSFLSYPQQIADMVSGTFTVLTTALKASTAAAARDFVLVGNTTDATDGHVPYRIRWCAINDPTDWDISAANQADFSDLKGSAGWVQRVTGGESPLVVCEKGCFRLRYSGAPDIWQIDEIQPALGTPSSGSVVHVGDTVYLYSWDGFKTISLGGGVAPIGAGKVDRWFKDNPSNTLYSSAIGVADIANRRIYWGISVSAEFPDHILCYEWVSGRWSLIEVDIEALFSFAGPGATLEQLETLYGYTNLDSIPYSLDSRAWTEGVLAAGLFNLDHRLTLPGPTNLGAIIDTGEAALGEGTRVLVRSVRPLVDGGTTTVAVATRNRQQDVEAYGSPIAVDENGISPQRSDGRYHRGRLLISGAWTRAIGIEVDAVPTGAR